MDERKKGFLQAMWSRRRFLKVTGQGFAARAGLRVGLGALGGLVGADLASSTRVKATSSLDTSWGWLPTPPATPGSLLVVDVNTGSNGQLTTAQIAALTILQGLANSLCASGGEAVYLSPSGDDVSSWPAIYAAQVSGLTINTGGAYTDIAALSQMSVVTEYVVWNPDVPATINVANMLAWLLGVAAFSSTSDATLLAPNLTQYPTSGTGSIDLSTLSSAIDAYTWALSELGTTVPETLALLSVGDMSSGFEDTLITTPRDYAVYAKSFPWCASLSTMSFSNLPSSGTTQDGTLIDSILASAPSGGTSTMFGWSDNEPSMAILASQNGLAFFAADSPGLPTQNLTVHNAIRTTAVQSAGPAAPTLSDSTVYVSIVFTDGDNPGVLLQFHEGRWIDTNHLASGGGAGADPVPVGWSMQGMAPSFTPGLAYYYFNSALNSYDEMVGWLPFGYPNLSSLVGTSNQSAYFTSAQDALNNGNLRVSQNMSELPPVYTETTSGLWYLLHGTNAPNGHFFGYTSPPGLYPVGEPTWINGKPVTTIGGYAPTGSPSSAPVTYATSGIIGAASTNPSLPLFVVVALGNNTTYEDAESIVSASYPGLTVQFVLPSQLVSLQQTAWSNGLLGTTLLGLATSVNIDPYFLGVGDQDSIPVLYNNGTTNVQARQVTDGNWAYEFNVESCTRAILTMTAIGAGTVEASTNASSWSTVGTIDTSSGEIGTLVADMSNYITFPTEHLWVRFVAGSEDTLTVTSLRLTYNGSTVTTAVTYATLPTGAAVLGITGSNLVANVNPNTPTSPNTVTPTTAPGPYALSFPVPSAGVATQGGGYGLISWIEWVCPFTTPSTGGPFPYVFSLSGLTGTEGKIYLCVWNGVNDIASQEIVLDSTAHTVSLLVNLPTSATPKIQVCAYAFPVDLSTVTPEVYAIS